LNEGHLLELGPGAPYNLNTPLNTTNQSINQLINPSTNYWKLVNVKRTSIRSGMTIQKSISKILRNTVKRQVHSTLAMIQWV